MVCQWNRIMHCVLQLIVWRWKILIIYMKRTGCYQSDEQTVPVAYSSQPSDWGNIRKDFRSISKTSSECQSLILEQNCIIRYRDTPAISDIEILLLKQKRSLPKEWIADWGNFLKCYHERIDPGTINYSQIVKTNPAFPIYARLLIDIWVRTTAMSKLDFNSFI